MGMTGVGGVGGGATPVQQVPMSKGGGPVDSAGGTPAAPTTTASTPGGPAGAASGADAVGNTATGGGGAVGAATGAGLNDPQVVELLKKLVEVLTQLIAALQGAAGGGAATAATASPGAAPTGTPAAGAQPAAATGGGQVQPAETKKASSWTVSSVATGHSWTMTPGQGAQLMNDAKFQLIPTYADGTKGQALAKGINPETM